MVEGSWVGLDVHARTTVAGVVSLDSSPIPRVRVLEFS